MPDRNSVKLRDRKQDPRRWKERRGILAWAIGSPLLQAILRIEQKLDRLLDGLLLEKDTSSHESKRRNPFLE